MAAPEIRDRKGELVGHFPENLYLSTDYYKGERYTKCTIPPWAERAGFTIACIPDVLKNDCDVHRASMRFPSDWDPVTEEGWARTVERASALKKCIRSALPVDEWCGLETKWEDENGVPYGLDGASEGKPEAETSLPERELEPEQSATEEPKMGNEKHIVPFFYKDGQHVRTVTVRGKPAVVIADLCKLIGLGNPSQVAGRLPEDEKDICPVYTPGGLQDLAVAFEPGVYRILLRSDKPAAEPLIRWVTHDVLPVIRKTGGYGDQSGMFAAALESQGRIIGQAIVAAGNATAVAINASTAANTAAMNASTAAIEALGKLIVAQQATTQRSEQERETPSQSNEKPTRPDPVYYKAALRTYAMEREYKPGWERRQYVFDYHNPRYAELVRDPYHWPADIEDEWKRLAIAAEELGQVPMTSWMVGRVTLRKELEPPSSGNWR